MGGGEKEEEAMGTNWGRTERTHEMHMTGAVRNGGERRMDEQGK